MNEKIYSLSKSINEELNSKEEVKLLNKLEKELDDSYEVYVLSNKKDEALEKYISNKDLYGDDSDITKESLKELKTAKENLNNHPLVKQYLEVYSKVRDLYLQINNILLDDFKGEHC